MSKLKSKFEKLAKRAVKKKAAYVNLNVTGFRGYKGEQIIFFVDCDDHEMKDKIIDNNLSTAERNFIVATIGEYVDETCRTNQELFTRIFEDVIIMYMEGQMKIPEWLLNMDFLNKCSRKKQGTQDMVFNKAKFKGMQLSEKVNVVTDTMDFFMEIWGGDYINKNLDINNLIRLNDIDNSDLEADDEEGTENANQITATLTSTFKRRYVKVKGD